MLSAHLVPLGAAVLLLAAALNASAAAPTYPGQKEADLVVKDFRFASGEVLPEVRLHYVTLGTPRRDAAGRIANAVLLLHGTSSTSKQWFTPSMAPELFGPGQPLDAAQYFVIVPDGLGRGGSTKPSDGLRAKFPRYGYGDVVAAQHLVVTKALGVEHLRAVVGTSMGGMQTWMWAERYPEMMDVAMPIACQPFAISGRNFVFRRILSESIRSDAEWQGGAYTSPPRGWLATAPLWPMMLESARQLQEEAPTRQASVALYDKLVETARKDWDANDFLYWIESSFDYDPQPDLGKIRAKVVAVNFADDAINPADLPETAALVRGVPGATFVLVPASDKTQGHLSLRLAALWKGTLADALAATARATAKAGR